jgi:hypothetical protein
MRYKGFIIQPVYNSVMRDGKLWDMDKQGRDVWRNPRKSDIDYYEILDPMENDKRWVVEDSLIECKATIDAFLQKVGMKDNSPKSWAKLDEVK